MSIIATSAGVGGAVAVVIHLVLGGATAPNASRTFAERMQKGVTECVKVTEATLVYVAIDEHGKPRILP